MNSFYIRIIKGKHWIKSCKLIAKRIGWKLLIASFGFKWKFSLTLKSNEPIK